MSESAARGQKRRRARAPDARADGSEAERGQTEDEGSGEDLMGDNYADDYKEMGQLDQYDSQMLDDQTYEDDVDARLAAEAALQERDRREGRRVGRLGAALESEEDEEGSVGIRDRRRRRVPQGDDDDGGGGPSGGDSDGGHEPFDLDDFNVPLKEWIRQEQTRDEISRQFRRFLDLFEDEPGVNFHKKVIEKMCAEGGQSLAISYLHLSRAAPTLAIWLADEPKPLLELFDRVALAAVRASFPDWYNDVHVRVTELPIPDSLRALRQVHLGVLVRVCGVVTRRSGVMPQMSVVRFNCTKCGTLSAPIQQTGAAEAKMTSCPVCHGTGPFELNSEETVYRNFQRLTLQESPGSVPAGRVPRSKEVILTSDLIDCARPGEEVDITGIYSHQFNAALNARNGFPVFDTIIDANFVKKLSDNAAHLTITEADRAEFDRLSKDPSIVRRVVRSIAPSIYGNDRAKLAVALAMFGGREKNIDKKHRIRGDINVLLLGDPGVAKSQILKYVEKTASRCVYTTGKGASAVGLTAAVHKDTITGEWMLEGGALVLADRGVCCIDEFDKMTDQDRTSIHEAMEQQSISISKAGIVCSLQARCAVVAAANPVGGRYDASKTFSENVQLTDPILTRFDVLCVLRDEVDPVLDGKLAEFVVRSHVRSHPVIQEAMAREEEAEFARGAAAAAAEALAAEGGGGGGGAGAVPELPPAEPPLPADMMPILAAARANMAMSSIDEGASAVGGDGSALEAIPQKLLRKYIVYARTLKPTLTNIDQEKVAQLYTALRRESEVSNGVPIAVRHIESIMRISEAAARMRHSNVVSDKDLDLAIRTTMESFIAAQKAGVQRTLRNQFARYLITDTNNNVLLLVKLRELVRKNMAFNAGIAARGERVEIRHAELVGAARAHGITEVDEFLRSELFSKAGFVYDAARRVVVRVD